ncbi:MAG TPA: hypothetical protein VND88_09670 [Candidatus Acidoferrales bacterium]|nr:hypothetical protein [Candidatus Acidoferrales bacterium]
MSLGLDVDLVTHVLLADGWHTVLERSFTLDSYEFFWSGTPGKTVADAQRDDDARGRGYRDPMVLHSGGNSGVCATGFSFKEEGSGWISGPLTAILGVRHGDAE